MELQAFEILRKRDSEYYLDLNDTQFNYTDFYMNNTFYSESDESRLQRVKNLIFPKSWTWILIFIHSVVFIIGLIGNILVCVAVYRNHTMRTVTNYFIVNLAVADFLVILLCLPPTVIWDVTLTWFFGDFMCKTVYYLQNVSVAVSVLTLTFISIDRWYAICFPLKFKSTTGRAKTTIAIIWLLALLFDIPELMVYQTVPDRGYKNISTIYLTQCEPSWSLETDRNWTILKMILLYVIPLIFMTVAYCQIIRVLWRSGHVRQHALDISDGRQMNTFAMNTNTSTESQLRSRRKAAKMLFAVVIMFAVCYFPVHLLCILRLTISMKNTDTNKALFMFSHWLCYANSAVNPIIYNFMSGKFRKEFHRAFEHCCQSTSNRQHDYQLSYLNQTNTERDSGSRSQSRSSKRTLTEIRRLDTLGRESPNHVRNNKNRRNSEKTIVSKLDM